jgi:hypothetical protein
MLRNRRENSLPDYTAYNVSPCAQQVLSRICRSVVSLNIHPKTSVGSGFPDACQMQVHLHPSLRTACLLPAQAFADLVPTIFPELA